MPKTMVEKIWDSHIVHEEPGQPAILYVDLHLVHEVTSPQAFDGLQDDWPPRSTPRPHGCDRRPQRSPPGTGRCPSRTRSP